MAQFRVELVLDPASGKYRAELYHPARQEELLVRTEPLFATQEAAVLGVVQLFKGVIPGRPKTKKTKKAAAARKAKAKPRKKAKQAKRKQPRKRRR